MSVQREDKAKSSCTSRGLGLAAAAIGVGVGAAVYYFLSKRPEHPDASGSTSEGWHTRELAEPLSNCCNNDTDSYTTISEHSTTDTSMDDSDVVSVSEESCVASVSEEDDIVSVTDEESVSEDNDAVSVTEDNEDHDVVTISEDSMSSVDMDVDQSDSGDTHDGDSICIASDDGSVDLNFDLWGIPEESHSGPSSVDISFDSPFERVWRPFPSSYSDLRSRAGRRMQSTIFSILRERSWSLEECTICFEVMLKDEQLMSLPCTHNFHVACIGPWLEQQQTCPVCRKSAE